MFGCSDDYHSMGRTAKAAHAAADKCLRRLVICLRSRQELHQYSDAYCCRLNIIIESLIGVVGIASVMSPLA